MTGGNRRGLVETGRLLRKSLQLAGRNADGQETGPRPMDNESKAEKRRASDGPSDRSWTRIAKIDPATKGCRERGPCSCFLISLAICGFQNTILVQDSKRKAFRFSMGRPPPECGFGPYIE